MKIYLNKNGNEIELSPEEKENLHIVEGIPRYAARKSNRVYAYTYRECMRRTAEIPDGCIAVWEYERETCGWNAGANYYGVCVARDPRSSDTDNRCVCCGDVIPEGRQVCPNCAPGSRGSLE